MSVDNKVLLKSSVFGGFKKKDVLSYIFELNETTQDSQQKLHEQIDELVMAKEDLEIGFADAKSKIASLQASLDDALARLDSANRQNTEAASIVEGLNAQLSKYEYVLKQKSDELERHTALNNELTEKNRVHEQKRGQVEQAAAQIKSLLDKAQTDAARLTAQAKAEADKVLVAAKSEAESLLENAKTDAGKLIESAKSEANELVVKARLMSEEHTASAKNAMNRAYEDFDKFLSETSLLQKTLLDASSAVTAKMEALHSAVERARASASEKAGNPVKPEDNKAECEIETENGTDSEQAAAQPDDTQACVDVASEILSQYGIRKDDSGFFRLSADK